MLLNMDAAAVKAFLNDFEDGEMLSEGEYVADFFDGETPITVNLRFEKNEIEILAAAKLNYDEEQDGWYMGDRIEDEIIIREAIEKAMGEAK